MESESGAKVSMAENGVMSLCLHSSHFMSQVTVLH